MKKTPPESQHWIECRNCTHMVGFNSIYLISCRDRSKMLVCGMCQKAISGVVA